MRAVRPAAPAPDATVLPRADHTPDDAARAAAHLDALAAGPRAAGGAGEARARGHAAGALAAAGFAVREEPFDYSAAVGRWATPAGGLVAVLAIHGAWRIAAGGRPATALALTIGAAVALAVVGRWAAREGVLSIPVLRRRATNLVAVRGAPAPRVWLVAHLDSKSQPVPIAVRAAGIVATALAWGAAAALAGAQASGAVGPETARAAWPWLAWGALACAFPVVASVVGDRSPGALDNASGVAAVLLAAEAAPRGAPLGVLLTSAEELGLAGARAWARAWAAAGERPATAVNCDGVDDVGRLTCMYGGRRPDALVAAASAAPGGATIRRLVPGILVDAVALADAGWDAITVSRGTVRTLARIHTPADRRERLTGAGVADAARHIGGLVSRLVAHP